MLGDVLEVEGYGPSVAQMLVERGWGPVAAKAGVGFQAGKFVRTNPGADMSLWVTTKRAMGWDSPVFAISIGPNDALACESTAADVRACAIEDILGLVDAIGPDKEIWWAASTFPADKAGLQATWNGALADVAAARPNVHVWDWPTVRAANAIPVAADGYHLPDGASYVRRSLLMADDLTARFSGAVDAGDPVAPGATVGPVSEYVAGPQRRLIDTRDSHRGPQAGELRLDLSADVPPGTTAVSVNLTAVSPVGPGFLSAYPCDAGAPATSNVNFVAGQTRPNQAVVALDAGYNLCVLRSTPTEVLVDLQGAFVPDGGLRLTPLAPDRLVDTRETGRHDPLVVPMPAGAEAVVLNVTAVRGAAPGFLVAYACGTEVPDTSNLNFVATDAVAGSVYAPVGDDGTVCIHSNQPVDVVVDLLGTFSATGDLAFQAAAPTRTLDTRAGTGGWRQQAGVLQSVPVTVAPPAAKAVTGNLTLVQPALDGFATAYGCSGPVPGTSSVNTARATISANAVTVGIDGDLCLRPSFTAHLLFDTTGWWLAT
jgi:hypothetical protein